MLFKLVERRRYYFLFSGVLILIGLATLAYSTSTTGSPLQLSIDFTGGALFELQFQEEVSEETLREAFEANGFEQLVVQELNAIDETSADAQFPTESHYTVYLDGATPDSLNNILPQLEENVAALDDATSEVYAGAEGVRVQLQFTEAVDAVLIETFLAENGFEGAQVQRLEVGAGSRWSVRTEEASSAQIDRMLATLRDLAPLNEQAISTSEVSGSVGEEVSRAAVAATVAATVVILGFIWFSFRKVPHAFRYGACAIVAMFHDILVVVTFMSILGLLFSWQADALFLTALLTVLGFSVQDSIVMFDRVRENYGRRRGESFELIVNRSVLETIHRSLGTQLNGMFIMVALILFGGETIRHFVVIMLLGLMSGTYSSIFIAIPLLVSWEKGEIPLVNRAGRSEGQSSAPAQV
ncbi:MAG: hypothetical protein HC915_01145 [Anaerolineae bacterium]|nr:hypothetical protein [Anaerolineae bacterium]